ncbi:protein translocase subunit SecF [candidate division WWE3 bacterium]|nr:protein translocase subunit SecF [candidate division WWE3 bacterium]
MNIVKFGKTFLIVSALILVPGIISLFVNGLNLSIDYTGGSVFEFNVSDAKNKENDIRGVFKEKNVEVEGTVFEGSNKIIVRTKSVDVATGDGIKQDLQKKFTDLKLNSFETVGPAIGNETTKKSLIALAIASFAIVAYISFAFRNIRKPFSSWKFGVSAVIAMLHDAFMVIGAFSILGKFYGYQVDALFITALLTIIGFSVHDTIVVYDRIRENLGKLPKSLSFSEIVNFSLVETLNRSLITSLTVIITLTSLLVLGGQSIRYFITALLIGIISGTYSSIFTATPIVVLWEEWGLKKKR